MRKNNIKIIGAMLFLSSTLNVWAMDSFSNVGTIVSDYAAQDASLSFIKDNFFLCATGAATAYCAMNLYKGYKKNRAEVYKKRDILARRGEVQFMRIPAADEQAIRQRINALGILQVEIVQGEFDNGYSDSEDKRDMPVVAVQTADDKACVFFNVTARKMLHGSPDEKNQVHAALEHEYDHIRRRQSEKDCLIGNFVMPMTNFFIGAAACKAAHVSLEKIFASPQNLLGTVGVVCAASCVKEVTNALILSAYSRNVERAADRAVVVTKDNSKINSLVDFCKMCDEKQKNWAREHPTESEVFWYDKWFATHPSLQERIETLEKALQS